MTHPHDRDDAELLSATRDLTPEEQSRLRRLSETGWKTVQTLLTLRSRASYSAADPEDFIECVQHHLTDSDRSDLRDADLYACPTCNRLLKDRRTPVASSVLLERTRLRKLWENVEQAPADAMPQALDQFRRGLGLRPS